METVASFSALAAGLMIGLGALGAAIGAGIGAGLFADYEEGVGRMTRVRRVFEPDSAMKPHYDRRYETYRELADTLGHFWRRQHAAREQ